MNVFQAPGTWRWMVGVAGVPALVQFILMLLLPESPRWLYRQNKVHEAQAILEKIYPANEVEEEMKALQSSVEAEKVEEAAIGDGMFSKIKSAWKNDVVRRGLYAGITVQLRRDHSSSGSAICGYGRRRLMILLMIGIIVCLVALAVVFFQASVRSPPISRFECMRFGGNPTCSSYLSTQDASSWSLSSGSMLGCNRCYKRCLPHRTSYMVNEGLSNQIRGFSSPTSGIVHHNALIGDGNSTVDCELRDIPVEIQRHQRRDSFFLVPETKGLPFEEVEKMLEKGYRPSICSKQKDVDPA
ncbi:hypothetical protein HYC85_017622 [Camellia sinensis]|uniref:Major facilitator superfamily (MFS) profile domain-containing protein n=1 Tax=Camellia sinensis TaxID=4442 RepID=A0A7J7GTL8_CAMSI|nr:hypothetical protein HYC85_017622 [Camellia sinensis]